MKRIPLFPLPGVVFFPGTLLPLHVFEPRYRAMVEDALAGNQLIGMALLTRDGTGSRAPGGAPAIRTVGGAGMIVQHERLEDGRFNLVLEGTFRYRILREEPSKPYRVALVEESGVAPFEDTAQERRAVEEVRGLFDALRTPMAIPPLPAEPVSAERLSGELALRLQWSPEKLQDLLEESSLRARFDAIRAQLAEWTDLAEMLRPFRPSAVRPLDN
jgi:Lon protease-like protein